MVNQQLGELEEMEMEQRLRVGTETGEQRTSSVNEETQRDASTMPSQIKYNDCELSVTNVY